MIFDSLKNHSTYETLGFNLKPAFKFLLETDLASLPAGRVELDGDRLYALVQEYETRTPEQGRWEAHRKYLDLQFMLTGRELMGFASLENMELQDYLPEKDFQGLADVSLGLGNTIEVAAGQFVIFLPQDAHRPCIQTSSGPELVKKIVLKVRL